MDGQDYVEIEREEYRYLNREVARLEAENTYLRRVMAKLTPEEFGRIMIALAHDEVIVEVEDGSGRTDR